MYLDYYGDSSRRSRRDHDYGHAPAAPTAAQGGAESWALISGTNKVPPYWGPEVEQEYPFKYWVKDVELWALSTELAEDKQGPVTAGRLGGVARSMAREMPHNMLVHGTLLADGTRRTGLESLVRGLAKRFAPLGMETAFRAMTEFLGFRRSDSEEIDSALARWEILKMRVAVHAVFTMSNSGYALLLLLALRIDRRMWPHLMTSFRGVFPTTDDELEQLVAVIRRECHTVEGTSEVRADKMSHSSNSNHFSMSYMTQDSGGPASAAVYGDWYGQTDGDPPWLPHCGSSFWCTDDEQFTYCAHCNSYLYADPNEGDISEWNLPWDADDTDSELDDGDPQSMSKEEQEAYLGAFTQSDTVDRLKQAYLFARRRFRYAAGKARRHDRFPRRFKGKGKGRYDQRGHYGKGKGYGSYFGGPLGPGSLAGGKGKKGNGGKDRKPLYDKNGDVMRCWECGSDQHLSSRCPNKHKGGSSGKGKGASSSSSGAGFTGLSSQSAPFIPISSSGPLNGGWYFEEKQDDANEWSMTETVGAITPEVREHFFLGVREEWDEQSVFGKSASALDLPVSEARKAMWLPWWPARDDVSGQQYFQTQTKMKRRKGEALLVDPGAHGDLTGSLWLERFTRMCDEAGVPRPVLQALEKPIEVGGVGAGSQVCRTIARCTLGVAGRKEEYAAPVIPDSPTPALLGIQSLRRRRCVIDCFSNRLYTIGPGGYKLSLSPGSREYTLEEAHSGHLMLPCTDFAVGTESGSS